MNDTAGRATSAQGTAFQTIRYRVTENGVAIVTIDVPGHKVNVLTPDLHREVGEVAALLAGDDTLQGAVLCSGKKGFVAGGDLRRIVSYYESRRSAADAYEQSRTFSLSLRQLETCGKPVAVAINGTALGGGLELALACHYRVVADDDRIRLGFPEVTLGLIPGAGGTQRLPRLIGLKKAVPMILDGTSIGPSEALRLGLVDAVCAPDQLFDVAERWVLERGNAAQPWDQKGFRIPGGSKLNDMNIGRLFQTETARMGATFRHNYPAPMAALRCLFNGSTVNSIDQGLRIESREFSALTRGPVARNIIRTLFINRRARKFGKDDVDRSLAELCSRRYAEEAQRMLREGLSPTLIRNAAWAAGMEEAPDGLPDDAEPGAPRDLEFDFDALKQRLLAIQSLAAAEAWVADGADPVTADLSSVLGWGFPSYTGGVLSHVDTLGLDVFVGMCDRFADDLGEHFRPSASLRERAAQGQRIYADEA